ncbi:unnamed protein product [Meganyctiphanes norvegica]|uniref:Uncharacterized protein n=1 Tax=Meganyctiphanes norvegica TaxID=48144 RepID=A0AAV2QR64_MEGNR
MKDAGMILTLLLIFLAQHGGTNQQNEKTEMHQVFSSLKVVSDGIQHHQRTRQHYENGEGDDIDYGGLETLVGHPIIISHKHIGPVKDGLLLVVPGDGTYTECQLKDSNLGCHRITTISTNTQGNMSYQNKDMKHHIENEVPLKHNDDSSTRNKSNIAGYSSLQDANRQLVMPLSAGVNSLPESQWWGGNITTHMWGVTFTLWHTFQHPGMYQVLVVFTEKSSLHPTWTKLKSVQVQDIFTIWTGHSHVLLLDYNTTGARASAFAFLHPMACSKDDTYWQWDFHDDHHDGVNVQVTLLNDTSSLEEWQQVEFDEFEELQKEMIDTVQLNGQMMENLNTGVWSHHVYHRAGTYDLTVAADCQGEAI